MRFRTFIKRKEIILLILLLSILSFNGERSHINAVADEYVGNEGEILSLTSHPAFNITHNDNFTDYSSGGTGAVDDPYIIENYNITTTDYNGIYVTGTTLYFVIQNCYVDADYRGIYIVNVAMNTSRLINNTCVNNDGYGIWIESSFFSTLQNNNCSNNGNGIYLTGASRGTLVNNTCNNNIGNSGIGITSSTYVLLENNTCNSNKHGIYLNWADNSWVIKNTFNNCWRGINSLSTDNVDILNNTMNSFSSAGIHISGGSSFTIGYNSLKFGLNGIYLMENSDTAVIINNTISNNVNIALWLEACHHTIIANNTISNNYKGLQIEHTTNCTIENNTFSNHKNGNYITNCPELTIQNNYFYNDGLEFYVSDLTNYLTCTFVNNWVNDKELGFFFNANSIIISATIYGQLILINCSDISITNQQLNSTSTGISLHYCEDITIENSNCYNNSINGIYFIKCDIITIHENRSYNNTLSGIHAEGTTGTSINSNICSNNTYGIYLRDSPSSEIFNNTCENNSQYGIYLYGSGGIESPWFILDVRKAPSDSCLITYNKLISNTEYGIYIETDNNKIYNNTFINNNQGGTSQAYDEGTGNTWYDTASNLGNYWNEWVSGSYSIDGSSSSEDPYPLSEIPIPPIISEYLYKNIFLIFTILPLILIGFIVLKRKK